MTKSEQVFQAARALPKRKRAELAQMLLASLDPPDLQPGLTDAEWVAEMTRRAEAATRSDWKGVSARTALTRARRDLKTRRK
jgi:hypothetical protein